MAGEREHDGASVTGGGRDFAVDFFVSYTSADVAWAEWIGWQLEAAGYSVLFQAWDFVAGANWQIRMQQHARRTIVVLSEAYLTSVYSGEEWRAAWAADADAIRSNLLSVRIEDCTLPELLRTRVYLDLFGLNAQQARRQLLIAVGSPVARTSAGFPGLARPEPPLCQTRVRHRCGCEAGYGGRDRRS